MPATTEQYRTEIDQLTTLAERQLAAVWDQVDGPASARDLLNETVPDLIVLYGSAAGTIAADWYDEVRAEAEIAGRFRAIVAELPDLGRAESLAGWAASTGTDPAATLSLAQGGLQRIVADVGRRTITGSSIADPRARGWQRSASGGCSFCQAIAARGRVFTESSVVFASHDHCFPAGVVVGGPSAEVGYRRWYEGELIIIRVAGGEELPVTPNHPVLTSGGWIAAGDLREGDDLIECRFADLQALQVPDEDHVPSPIEDVWGAKCMDRLRSVPVAAEDFHGDAGRRQGNVDVVATDRLLAHVVDPARIEQAAQDLRARARSTAVPVPLARRCDPLLPLIRAFGTPNGVMRSTRELEPLLPRQPRHPQQCSVTRATGRYSGKAQPAHHDVAGHAIVMRHRQHALASVMTAHDIGRGGHSVVGRASGPRPRFDAPLDLKRLANPIGGTAAERGRDLIERLAGGVHLRRVVELRGCDFRGHVYNLQTSEGWYTANSLVVSNCKCVAVPAWDGRPVPVQPYTPSKRTITDAERARVRQWIAEHGL